MYKKNNITVGYQFIFNKCNKMFLIVSDSKLIQFVENKEKSGEWRKTNFGWIIEGTNILVKRGKIGNGIFTLKKRVFTRTFKLH